jgi:hypothetical protein
VLRAQQRGALISEESYRINNMERKFLVKQYPALDIAHLYEHLFFKTVTHYFTQHKQYQYVDYSMTAKTTIDGVIIFDFELYTNESKQLFRSLVTLPVHTKEQDIINVLSQLVAEEEKTPHSATIDELQTALGDVDAISWQVFSYEPDKTQLTRPSITPKKSFYFTQEAVIAGPVITVSVEISRKSISKNKDAIIVFNELAKLIIDNLQVFLPDEFGIYSYKDESQDDEKMLRYINLFKTTYTNGTQLVLADIAKSAQEYIRAVMQPEILKRYRDSLPEDSSYPGLDKLMTDQRIEDVFSKMTLRVTRQDESVEQHLKARKII